MSVESSRGKKNDPLIWNPKSGGAGRRGGGGSGGGSFDTAGCAVVDSTLTRTPAEYSYHRLQHVLHPLSPLPLANPPRSFRPLGPVIVNLIIIKDIYRSYNMWTPDSCTLDIHYAESYFNLDKISRRNWNFVLNNALNESYRIHLMLTFFWQCYIDIKSRCIAVS